jgi:hypothetical protein
MICYSPEVAKVQMAFQKFQKERYYLCEAGGQPLTWTDDVILSENIEKWVEAVPAEIITDKKTKRWIEFQELVKQWKGERGSRSSITQAAAMQPYQKIIGMGPDAIPLILAQLKSEGDNPDQWFWALRAITRENPVLPEDRGNFRKMAQAWFEWAEQRAYAW